MFRVILNFRQVSVLFLILSCAKAFGQSALENAFPTISKLNPQVIFHPMLDQAPTTTVKTMVYESIELPTKAKYSDYVIHLDHHDHHITQYHTIEKAQHGSDIRRVKDNSIIFGKGVGHGGIFSLAYLKHQELKTFPQIGFLKRYEIEEIISAKGQLFPLKVGNTLDIQYRSRELFERQGKLKKNQTEIGRFIYQVKDQWTGYSIGVKPVPGNIFVIRVFHASENDPILRPMFEYWYSENFGWYIATKYYKEGQWVARYRLIDWA